MSRLATRSRSAEQVCPPSEALTIVYSRVSDERQADDDRTSLDDQERECRAFAGRIGRTVDFVWTDPGVSGRDEERLERLTEWCQHHPRHRGTRGLVIALNASRWGRFVSNPHASDHFKYLLRKSGWDVEFALQPRTGNRTTDGVVSAIHDAQAAAESEERSRRARTGMAGQAGQGYWVGRPPYGYDRVAIHKSTQQQRLLAPRMRAADDERTKLVPGPKAEVRAVEQMFEWAAAGVSFEEIARRLNRAKVSCPSSRYPRVRADGSLAQGWTAFGSVTRILENPAYVGQLQWWPRNDDGSRATKPILCSGAHQALVDQDTWEKVQRRFQKQPHKPRGTKGRYLLLGVLRCVCGEMFVGGGGSRAFVRSGKDPTHVRVGARYSHEFRKAAPGEQASYVKVQDPDQFRFYRCPSCVHPRRVTVNARSIEQTVVREVGKHVKRMVKRADIDTLIDEVAGLQNEKRTRSRVSVQQERAQIDVQIARIVSAVANGIFSEMEAQAKLGPLRDRREAIDAQRHRERFVDRRSMLTDAERKRLKDSARDFESVLQRVPLLQARELLRAWVPDVLVDGRDVRKRTARIVLRRIPVDFSSSHSEGR